MESIVLNLIPTGVRPTCHVSQNDNDRRIKVNLVEGSLAYAIKEDDVIKLNLKKPDDAVVSVTVSATAGNTYVVLEIADNMCDIDGKNLCELRIVNGSTSISTSNFYMDVETDPTYVPVPPVPPTPTGRRGGLTATEIEVISTTYEAL